jgi:hypothetical protein
MKLTPGAFLLITAFTGAWESSQLSTFQIEILHLLSPMLDVS